MLIDLCNSEMVRFMVIVFSKPEVVELMTDSGASIFESQIDQLRLELTRLLKVLYS